MRIFFIPGFAEDESIFNNLAPLIDGDKVVLNSWKLLGNQPREHFNALKLAAEFTETYKITLEDVLSVTAWAAGSLIM